MYHSLLLLVLIGLGSLTEGQRYVYTFINDSMTWLDAAEICRANYTDLATLKNTTNVTSICPNTNGCRDAWVRFNNISTPEYKQNNGTWYWINSEDTYNETKAKWKNQTPNNNGGNCVYVSISWDPKMLYWSTKSCASKGRVICYDDKPNPKKYEFIPGSNRMSWIEALTYCRKRNTSLVSGHPQVDDDEFESEVINGGGSYKWWIGLHSCTNLQVLSMSCARLNDSQLIQANCTENHPFICYDDLMVLVKENKTWEAALLYCRRNYCDLAVMTDPNEEEEVVKKAKMADTDFVWVGLHYVGFFEEWVWVNGMWLSISDKIWKNTNELNDCSVSGAIQRGGDKLVKEKSDGQYNFICSLNC